MPAPATITFLADRGWGTGAINAAAVSFSASRRESRVADMEISNLREATLANQGPNGSQPEAGSQEGPRAGSSDEGGSLGQSIADVPAQRPYDTPPLF
jgi:hypothetical protein